LWSGFLDLSANLCVEEMGAMKGEIIVYGLLGWAVFLLIAVKWIEVLERRHDRRLRERPKEIDNDPY
jgi:hypothetical protein